MPAPTTFENLLQRNNEINQNKNGINWYLSFKQAENCQSLETRNNIENQN